MKPTAFKPSARALALVLAAPLLAIAPPALAQAADAPGTQQTDQQSAAALAPVPQGKLSDAARPKAYRIDLSVDPAQERFSGAVQIDVELKQPSRFIDLHGRDLAVDHVLARAGDRTIAGHWHQLDETGVARVVFDDELPAGPLVLDFSYSAAFNTVPSGLYRVKVGDDWYAWSQFESIDARAAFPSFDEPGFKTPLTLTLRTPPGLSAVSNAPEQSNRREGALDVHRFAPTLPLPTYLAAVMVGPFVKVEGQVAPTAQRAAPLPLRIVSTRPNAGQLEFALDGSREIVRLLEAYFDQPFPYPKLDQITSPIMPGAMENAGADLYGDSILVLDPKAATEQKRLFGMVVAHELSHQWFGDLVTPAWWDDIWLNESFANWMGFRIGGEWRPDLNIGAGGLAEGFEAMRTDALAAGRPIHQPIDTNAQIDEAFDTITYGKGGHVIAMIAAFMGDTRFRDGVRRYMHEHGNGNATSADFFRAMAEVSGDPRILPAMQSFTDQQGVPLLTFSASGDGSYEVVQSRYARLGAKPPPTRWGIPLCLHRLGGETRCQLLTDERTRLSLGGEAPLMPNAGGTGYYRFELPAAEWDALIGRASTLPGLEGLALADSLYASFQAGRSTPRQMLEAARSLADNPDSYAAEAGIANLESLAGTGLLGKPGKKGMRRFLETIYRAKLEKLGFDPRAGHHAGEEPEVALQRERIVARLALAVRDGKLRGQLGAAAEAYLKGDAGALDPVWFGPAFAIRLGKGKMPAARALADRALASQDPLFRPAALGALAGSGQPAVARWLLEDFADPRLRRSERIDLIAGVLGNGGTAEYGFSWLKQNIGELLSGSSGIFLANRLPRMLAGFCSLDKADAIDALLRPRLEGKTGALALERTVEQVRSCASLRQARGAEFTAALAKVR